MTDGKREKIYLDFIKIFAIIFVVFNHTGYNGSILYTQYSPSEIKYWFWLFLSNFCRVNVPLFFMVSGALLLDKDERLRDIFEKRVYRIAKVLLGISFLHYMFVDVYLGGTTVSFRRFVKLLYSCNLDVVYWFLYAYISFLITLPFLRSLVRNLNKIYFVYLGILAVIYLTLRPIINLFVFHNKTYMTGNLTISWLAQAAVIFPIFGYYIEKYLDITSIKVKHIISILGILLVCSCLNCYMSYISEILDGKHIGMYRDTFSFLNTVLIFLILKWIYFCSNNLQKYKEKITLFGSYTFGIYVFHIVIMKLVNNYELWKYIHNILHRGLGVVAYVAIILILSVLMTVTIKKVKLFKDIL